MNHVVFYDPNRLPYNGQKVQKMELIVPQLSKCLNFYGISGVILYGAQSFLSPRIDFNFRHLSSCDTIESVDPSYFSLFLPLPEQSGFSVDK